MDYLEQKKSRLNIPAFGIIILAGIILRIVFVLFIARHFFGRTNVFVGNDTLSWSRCFQSLLETGTYTVNPQNEYGFFVRMPGYSFFLGIFYLLAGKNWALAYPIVGWTQIFLDAVSIYLIYRIGKIIFKKERVALILQGLYAFYPFIFVWNPVCHSETVSAFIMISGLYFFVRPESSKNIFLAGLIWGLGGLFRPQLILLAYVAVLVLFWQNRRAGQEIIRTAGILSLGFLLTFISWPARNIINHHKLVITQDLRGIPKWKSDVLCFYEYITSVKPEWEPQFSQLVNKQKVSWPEASFISKQDSLKLMEAERLSKTCSAGFREWEIKRTTFSYDSTTDCTTQTGQLYAELFLNQKKNNPVHYWLVLPVYNLGKALFKTRLSDSSSSTRSLASLLFIYRTILLLLGMAGLIVCWKFSVLENRVLYLIAWFFIVLYLLLCAGSGPQYRNIEIRYFLHADILLLIPAAFLIDRLLEKFFPKKIMPA